MNNDLKFAQIYEDKVSNYYIQKGHKVKQSVGKFKPYDVIIDGKHKIEIKADKHIAQCLEDPNVVIETRCNGQPSGLTSTEAEIIIYFFTLNNTSYKIVVNRLREYINSDDIKPRIENFTNSDGQRAWGYLLRVKELVRLNIAKEINVW